MLKRKTEEEVRSNAIECDMRIAVVCVEDVGDRVK